jgi:hypothetical protein
MVDIVQQPIRAEIVLGDLTISTPDVISFNVSRRRGQASATFSASLKIHYTYLDAVDFLVDQVIIRAGEKGSLKTVFTGYVYQAVINPVRTDASKVMLNISGADPLSKLEGQIVNRRVKTWRDGDGPPGRWGIVNNIIKEHTPLAKRFPVKLYTPENVAVYELKNDHIIRTPDAFKAARGIERTGTRNITGGIVVEKMPSGE